jgi:hypothetical protein
VAVPQAAAAPSDPPAGSPSGAVYELPVERGRNDAAPQGDSGDDDSGGIGASGSSPSGGSGSLYRSENNFGSSSQVPGAGPAGDDENVLALRSAADLEADDPSGWGSFLLLALIGLGAVAVGLFARRVAQSHPAQ